MRFDVAWGKVASENYFLKVMIIGLLLLTAFFGIATLKLSLKDALVIDRGCFSKANNIASTERTSLETEAFLRESLSQRFDTEVEVLDGYISADEKILKIQELKDLETKGFKQKIVINSIQSEKDLFKVDADRVIRVGEVRSAFKFPLVIKLESKSRSQGNPYGLMLVKSEVVKTEKK